MPYTVDLFVMFLFNAVVLSVTAITLASIIPNLLGGLIYAVWFRRTKHPFLYYGLLSFCLAVLDSIMQMVLPTEPGFAAAVTPLHFIVAIISLVSVIMARRGL